MIIDSHCHLDFPDFEQELDDIILRAEKAGVGRMVTISTRVKQFDRIRAVAERFDNVYCSVGTHPHQAAEEPDVTVEELVLLAKHPKVVAIGEAGLDYFYDFAPREAQAEGLKRHIKAARHTGLPLVIHSRDADKDMINILESAMLDGKFDAILHCFSSGPELARRGVEMGLYLSFSGILTFKRSQEIREIAKTIPLDRLLVETDAPYLAPQTFRGKRNEPSYVVETAKVLADIRSVEYDEIALQTTENFFRLFKKVPGPEPE
ncbi:MAG: TatD family hydrolase [Cohaesibacteraceae bacterium]|nr:TatD family hydrolase [Cohaesibacteraceae bacterium]